MFLMYIPHENASPMLMNLSPTCTLCLVVRHLIKRVSTQGKDMKTYNKKYLSLVNEFDGQ